MSLQEQDHSGHHQQARGGFLSSRAGWVAIGFLVIIGALLFTEHRAHVPGVLIWLPLLACPLMHMFMHHGHDGHAQQRDQPARGKNTP